MPPQQPGQYNYYQQQQPGYVPPYYPPAVPPSNEGDKFAVASLILGILSVVTCCSIFISIICGIIGLILGIVGKSKGAGGMAVAGILLSVFGILLSIIGCILAFTGNSFYINYGFDELFNDSYDIVRFLR